jgi:aminocarboxymuconate-semialdehyde decarboxylase
VTVGAFRIKTVDVHCHVSIPEAPDLLNCTSLVRRGGDGATPAEIPLGPERLQKMDEDGIDIQAVSVNPFW